MQVYGLILMRLPHLSLAKSPSQTYQSKWLLLRILKQCQYFKRSRLDQYGVDFDSEEWPQGKGSNDRKQVTTCLRFVHGVSTTKEGMWTEFRKCGM